MSRTVRWQPWAFGAAVVVGIGGWLWWQAEHPELMNGDYWCEGHTVAVDGARSLINASAEVVEHKIRVGQTGLDLAFGSRVTDWGDVKTTSRTQFLAEIHPRSEIHSAIRESFWIVCDWEN